MKHYTFDQYTTEAERTAPETKTARDRGLLAALGLVGEAGEFADLIKKWAFHGHPLGEEMRVKMAEEVGDILWYCTAAARFLDIPLSDIAAFNTEKLKRRYPEGFSSERSINRKGGS